MKILWNVGSRQEAALAVVAAQEFTKNDIGVLFITSLHETANFLKDKGCPVVFADESALKAPPLSEGDLIRLDKEFPLPGIRFLAFSEARAYRRDDVDAFYHTTGRTLLFWQALIERDPPDALLSWQSASLFNRAPLSICAAMGVPTLTLINGPSLGRVTIADLGEREVWTELLDALDAPKSYALDAPGHKLVEEHIREISEVNGKFKPRTVYVLPDKTTILTCLSAIIAPGRSKGDVHAAKINLKQYWERISWKTRLSLGLLPYKRLDPKESYIYFPMQNTADIKLTGRNPVYADQLALAEQIALSMRPGMTLYVREHPNHPGMYDNARLRRLLKHPFVKLIHPYESNIDLIKNAAAVVCVNSTAAWEAYVNRVPLVVLGHPFVRWSRLVFGVDGLNDLSGAIRRAVDEGPSLYRECEDEWRWFMHVALTTCPPGHSFGYKTIFGSVPAQDMTENGARVGQALLAKLRRLTGQLAVGAKAP